MNETRSRRNRFVGDLRRGGRASVPRVLWLLGPTVAMAAWPGVARADAGPVLPFAGLGLLIVLVLGVGIVLLAIAAWTRLRRIAAETRAQQAAEQDGASVTDPKDGEVQ